MKSPKLLLTGVCFFAIVAGALAFKAARFGKTVFTTDANGVCSVPYLDHTITNAANGEEFIRASALKLTTTCPETWVKIEG